MRLEVRYVPIQLGTFTALFTLLSLLSTSSSVSFNARLSVSDIFLLLEHEVLGIYIEKMKAELDRGKFHLVNVTLLQNHNSTRGFPFSHCQLRKKRDKYLANEVNIKISLFLSKAGHPLDDDSPLLASDSFPLSQTPP